MGTIAIDLSLKHSTATLGFGALLLSVLIAAMALKSRKKPGNKSD